MIITFGVINAATHNKPETPVFMGGVGLLLLASLLEAMGEGPARIGTGLVALALTTVIIVEGPSLFQALQNAQQGKKSSNG